MADDTGGTGTISVFLADDNVLVREGVRALLVLSPTWRSSGTAADYDELVDGAGKHAPQVVVTDIRMPPSFQTRASRPRRRSASGTLAPASSSCRSTTTPNTPSRCSTRARPATRIS